MGVVGVVSLCLSLAALAHRPTVLDELKQLRSEQATLHGGVVDELKQLQAELDEVNGTSSMACASILCGGYGSCRAGACECAASWTGAHCETAPRCGDTWCSDHGSAGSCLAGACECAAGWSGPACQWQDSDHSCPRGADPPTPGSRYCGPMIGVKAPGCVGPEASKAGEYHGQEYKDPINGKSRRGVATRTDCQAFCDAAPACVGYWYISQQCNVFGAGLDRDISAGWTALTYPAITIGGGVGARGTDTDDRICVAVAGRN